MNVERIRQHLQSGKPVDDLTNWKLGKDCDGEHYIYRMRLATDDHVYGIMLCDFPMEREDLGELEEVTKSLAKNWNAYRWNWYPENKDPAIELTQPDDCCIRQYIIDIYL